MKSLIILIIGNLLLSSNLVGQNTLLDKYYTKNENITINELLSQFDLIIKQKTENNETSNAYLDFANYIKSADTPKEYHDKLFSVKSEIDSLIVKYRNTEFFKNTWYYSHSYQYPNIEDTLSTMLEIRKDSKFIKLLKYRKRKNNGLKDYYEAYLMSLGIAPTMVASFPYIIETLDLNNKSDRLLIAVHFITIISETKKTSS